MIKRKEIMTLEILLQSDGPYIENDCLFIENGDIFLKSLYLVDPADLYDVEYVPPLALENNLKYYIMMDTYNDIIINLQNQIKEPTIEQKFEALKFYLEADAFKKFT